LAIGFTFSITKLMGNDQSYKENLVSNYVICDYNYSRVIMIRNHFYNYYFCKLVIIIILIVLTKKYIADTTIYFFDANYIFL